MYRFFFLVRNTLWVVGAMVIVVMAVLVISLALPVKVWRTGQLTTEPIPVRQAQPVTAPPIKVWIDTDAACGEGSHTDPDDCLAILLLAQQAAITIVGVSTIFGNAPLSQTDRTARDLIHQIQQSSLQTIPVYRGSSAPLKQEAVAATVPLDEAHEALRHTLEHEPLVILALGPLTNVAIALKDRPHLQANVTRLVAVMGRRKGHVFHPIEGGTAHSFLGHGPIFRDFNVTEDERAAANVIEMRLPLTLIPYEAARDIFLDASCLDKMEALGGSAAWVAHHAREWLFYWKKDIGVDGFYPFDLVAAAYVAQPSLLRCAKVPIAMEDDTWLFGWLGYRGLFVEPGQDRRSTPSIPGSALYCPESSTQIKDWLVDQLTGVQERTGPQARRPAYQAHDFTE